MKLKPFKLSLLSFCIISSSVQAGIVRGDVDYQYFRDFAENKGRFYVGAKNVHIFDKQGYSLGIMLQNIPMMDLSVLTRTDSRATLLHPQYLVGVQHNNVHNKAQFGDSGSENPDNNYFDYHFVARNESAPGTTILTISPNDFHSPRLHKLVTEVVPIAATTVVDPEKYLDTGRYPIFIRAGSGRQHIKETRTSSGSTEVAGSYLYLTGGTIPELTNSPHPNLIRVSGSVFESYYSPLTFINHRGDSGSGLFGYDAYTGTWFYAGSVQAGNQRDTNFYINLPGFTDGKIQEDLADTIQGDNQTLLWTPNGKTSSIRAENQEWQVDLADTTLADTNTEKPSLEHGKTFTIAGENNTLRLTSDINQGAGAIYFEGNTTVEADAHDTTWLGAGISIAEDKEVTWKIHNPNGDRLSKIGKGKLIVNGVGKNLGDISVGDGTVVLDQRADSQGEKQAFNKLGITSGRATVILNSSDQVNPDNIYFGFRGGRLDVNGNDLSFTHIQNVDEGANLVNHNVNQKANITIKGYLNSQAQHGSGERSAFNGFFGEIDPNKPNGELNITYSPTLNNATYLISGGTNLNGVLHSQGTGKLLLSGRPVAYARDTLNNNAPVIKDGHWLNRTFTATTFKVSENAKLEVGRNVTEVNGNIEVADNAVAVLGFTQGKSTQCIRSDYTGEVSCEENHRITNAGLASWQKTQVKGDARLTENARLELGSKAEMTGAITAEKSTALLLHEDAVLHLNQDSTTGRVTAAPSSTIHLAEGKNWTTLASSTLGTVNIDNATVKLNDEQASLVSPNTFSASHLKGRGTFHFVVDMVNAVSDVINVTETATGIFNAIITPKGTASSNSPIKLLEASRFDNFQLLLGSAVQSAHYLYNLVKEENAYWLKAVDRRLAFTFDTETLTANSLSADQLSTKGNYLVTINPTGDDPVSTGKTLLIGANNPDQLAGIELELVGADSNNEIQIGPYKYRIAKEADGYYLITDHQQSVLPEEVDDPNYDIVEDEKPVADFNGDTANTTPPATTPPTTTPPTTTPPTTNNPGGNTGTGNSGGQTGGQTGNTGTGNTGTGNTHTTPPETSFTPELQSQVNAVLDTTSTLDNLLRGEHTDNWKVWSRAEHRHNHFDFPTQQAKQQGVLTQVGVEKHLGNRTWVGAVLSQSNNHSEFSKATGQHKLTMLSLYAKKQGENGLFIGGDISGGQSRNRLSLQGERATFQRKILSVGMHLGQEWAWNDIRITPSMGVRYHHLSNADYQLQGKAIHTPHTDVLSYHAGVQVAKTFDLGGWHIKPSLSSSYIHTNQQLTTRVNTAQFNQQLGAHFKHEVGLSVGGKQLSVHMNAGIIRGREIKRQHTAGVKVVYQW